jgi:hypothetical protein
MVVRARYSPAQLALASVSLSGLHLTASAPGEPIQDFRNILFGSEESRKVGTPGPHPKSHPGQSTGNRVTPVDNASSQGISSCPLPQTWSTAASQQASRADWPGQSLHPGSSPPEQSHPNSRLGHISGHAACPLLTARHPNPMPGSLWRNPGMRKLAVCTNNLKLKSKQNSRAGCPPWG